MKRPTCRDGVTYAPRDDDQIVVHGVPASVEKLYPLGFAFAVRKELRHGGIPAVRVQGGWDIYMAPARTFRYYPHAQAVAGYVQSAELHRGMSEDDPRRNPKLARLLAE